MGTRFDMADALVRRARRRLAEFEPQHREALNSGEVSADLQITVKEILDHLRSALDYCAKEVHDRCAGPPGDVYFPVAVKGANPSDFRSLVGKKIKGVLGTRDDLVQVLASFQEFASPDNVWLPDLVTLSCQNKHEQFSELERQRMEFFVKCGAMPDPQVAFAQLDVWAAAFPGARVAAVKDGKLFYSDKTVEDLVAQPQPVNLDEIRGETPDEEGRPDVVCLSLQFSIVQREVGPFLSQAIDGVARIVGELRCRV